MRSIPVLTPEQSRAWDATADAAGRSLRVLMENAGRAVALLALDRFAMVASQGVLVACGPGNNGGDGWVAARALRAAGVPVWATELTLPGAGAAADARATALQDGVRLVPADGPWPGIGLIVDALLGTGASGPPRGAMMPLVQRLAELTRPVVAVDGPTGLDLATGVQHGPLRAALSVTFGGVRRGHLLARDEIGDLIVVEIGLPAPDPGWPVLVGSAWAAERVVPFRANAYKGTRGRVVIVGGSLAMVGAVRLAARAAFGAGAGLVHVVAPEASLAIVRAAEPDVQTIAQEFSGAIDPAVQELIARADAVAIGPGLGRDAGRAAFVLAVLAHARRAVVDADALTVLKPERDALAKLGATRPIVCTPHVGEFRTLFPDCAVDLETAPWDAALHAAASSGVTVLLKGVPTVVASPDGTALTVAAGNPGLATGGSGDVLTGIIAALLAQGVALADAAAAGAQAHGEAADHAARRVTARAMRPMDVVTGLQDVWRAWGRPARLRRVPILDELPAPETI
jgi:ADP-dependent NAD(P)H-hydrate dehydratase / NAD(P)H-hydrate epimerase